MCKCLYCYKELEKGQKDFHPGCARKFFGTSDTPLLEYRREELDALAAQVIQAQTSLTGVQPKLSLNLHKHEGSNRLTIVGLWGDFIFKPQTDAYPELPELRYEVALLRGYEQAKADGAADLLTNQWQEFIRLLDNWLEELE